MARSCKERARRRRREDGRDREERARSVVMLVGMVRSTSVEEARRRRLRDGGDGEDLGGVAVSPGRSCERRRLAWAGVSVEGALPATCVVRCAVHSSALASARDRHWDGRAIPATEIAPSWNAVEWRRGWYLRMARQGHGVGWRW